ncbi:MAG: formimidoylglutamase [Tissierellia bacterium]|nr:formimidoylglutamase [Tissierellia bacterium]
MINNYIKPDQSIWTGRIDSEEDYDALRWHQWIKFIDLNDESTETFTGILGFALLGFKSDKGIEQNLGRVGAYNGPAAIRKELANKPCSFSPDLKLFDAGDITSEYVSLIEAQESLAQAVDKILSLNLFPILLGGGHEISYGHYKGIFDHFQNKNEDVDIGIVNFDAHFDNRPYEEGMGTSGTMFRQIYDLNKQFNKDYYYFVLGIQKSANTRSLFNYSDETKTKYVLAKEITNGDVFSIFGELDKFVHKIDHLYITIDSDVFSSSVAPGVSAPQPLGLDPEKVIILLKYLLGHDKAISIDIAEVSPRFDMDNSTSTLAAILIFAIITKLGEWLEYR